MHSFNNLLVKAFSITVLISCFAFSPLNLNARCAVVCDGGDKPDYYLICPDGVDCEVKDGKLYCDGNRMYCNAYDPPQEEG